MTSNWQKDYRQVRYALERNAPRPSLLGWIEQAVNDVLTGRLPIAAVRHPLGFVCLPITRIGDEGACVHLWSPDWRPATLTTSETHCHSWELVSYVVNGQLRNQVVLATDDPSMATHRVFEVHSGPTGDDIRATARLVRPEPQPAVRYRSGDVYRLRAGVFHRTLLDTPVVVTLALGRGRRGTTDLSLGDLDAADHHVNRELYDRADTIRVAELMLRLATRQRNQPNPARISR